MLTEEQQLRLSERVLSFIGMGPDPGQLTELAGGTVVRNVPAGKNGALIADWLLKFSLQQSNPALFIRIVRTADFSNMHPDLHALAFALDLDPSRWTGSGTDELWGPDPPRRPFVDRAGLRKVLQSMAEGNGPAAITIDAPNGQGKKTICDYIGQLAARTESFTTVIERELRGQRGRGQLDRIVFDLRTALGLDDRSETTHVEPERVGIVMARDLANDVLVSPPARPIWLVINLVDTRVEDGVIRFIDELLFQVNSDADVAASIRLVLLTDRFQRFRLQNLPDVEHRHALPEITDVEIKEWFAAAVPGMQAKFYGAAADDVLRRLDKKRAAQSQRLMWLARFCDQNQRKLAARS